MKKRLSVIIKGVVLSLVLTLMLSALLAAAVFFGDISDNAITAFVFFIAALSCIAGAYASGKALESKGLITGGTLGLIYYIVLFFAAAIIKKNISSDSHMLIMLVAAVFSGMLGGVLGMPRK